MPSPIIRGGALALALLSPASVLAEDAAATLAELSVQGTEGGSVTVPSVAQQRAAVGSTVGSVAFVDAAEFQNRYANTLRDVLKDTPGVFVQQRYGQELRLSVRGSGISRGFHLRGIELLQDGIPVNLADGSGDFYQIDPLALRSVEVYKGGNALTFGATTLGGAINFVTPTAYTAFAPNILRIDGGSFGTIRENFQFSRISGPADFLINGTITNSDGYRTHETQRTQNFNANLGYRLAPGVETRFYAGIYLTDQKLPGTLTLFNALNTPTLANPTAISGNQSRKVETERIANRTSFVLDVGKLDIDTWAIHKSLYHPIFQVIDQDGWTYGISPHWAGTFDVAGYRNDTILGLRASAGINSALQFNNRAGQRNGQTLSALQSASNYEAYGENRFWFLPDVALMAGAKAFSSNRTYSNKGGFAANPNVQFGNRTYEGINPKLGLIWQPVPDIQVFGDIARSRDVPDFSDLAQTSSLRTTFVPLEAQRAWTYEAGSRGRIDRLGLGRHALPVGDPGRADQLLGQSRPQHPGRDLQRAADPAPGRGSGPLPRPRARSHRHRRHPRRLADLDPQRLPLRGRPGLLQQPHRRHPARRPAHGGHLCPSERVLRLAVRGLGAGGRLRRPCQHAAGAGLRPPQCPDRHRLQERRLAVPRCAQPHGRALRLRHLGGGQRLDGGGRRGGAGGLLSRQRPECLRRGQGVVLTGRERSGHRLAWSAPPASPWMDASEREPSLCAAQSSAALHKHPLFASQVTVCAGGGSLALKTRNSGEECKKSERDVPWPSQAKLEIHRNNPQGR